MARIPPPVKIKKDGVEMISHVDRAQYTLHELMVAALFQVAKLIRRRLLDQARKLPGHRRGRRITKAFGYFVDFKTKELKVGIYANTWYGKDQELGANGQPRRQLVRQAVHDNIDEIRKIEGAYLSAIEDENKALGIINDSQHEGELKDDE